ncbi:MAG: hypothetical protein FP814_10425 [Desulfobacterium sp.]|nr:hypothetical protein [Desulfobacterium sp.]
MNINDFMPVSLETLNSFKEIKHPGDKIAVKGVNCCCCNEPVSIHVVKTESGFGLLNGHISEPQNGEMFVICEWCSNKYYSK